MTPRILLRPATVASLLLVALWSAAAPAASAVHPARACAPALGLRGSALDCVAALGHALDARDPDRLAEGRSSGSRLPRGVLVGCAGMVPSHGAVAPAARVLSGSGRPSALPSSVLRSLVSSGKADLPPPLV